MAARYNLKACWNGFSMQVLKICIFVLIAWLFSGSVICVEDQIQTVYIKGVRCNASSLVYSNFSCFPKSFNRSFSTLNVNVVMKKPLNSFLFQAKLFYKYGTIYREVMHTPLLDWCQLMKDSTTNLMVKQVIAVFNESSPSSLHECPYKEIIIKYCNVKTSSLQSLFPAGDYKLILYFFDANAELFFTINVIGSMFSPLKETFG